MNIAMNIRMRIERYTQDISVAHDIIMDTQINQSCSLPITCTFTGPPLAYLLLYIHCHHDLSLGAPLLSSFLTN